MSYRHATDLDKPWVMCALTVLATTSNLRGWVVKPKVWDGYEHVNAKIILGDAYIVDEAFLVLVSDFEPWYGRDKILQEELVLKLHDGGFVGHVLSALRDIAKERQCTGLTISDSSFGLALSRFYSRKGLKHITNTFYEDVPHG